ncbi:hypothetical protein GLYMA_14G069251v4 [Glycine max]|nr:hypothetical protein GLYMA_14G069251v4 [Glycine max]KAH1093408.1 hypothetical protein GYH30_039250 [Glycine max]
MVLLLPLLALMLALNSWKKIEKANVDRRLLGAMHHCRTYTLICF